MKDARKTKAQLFEELDALRARVAELKRGRSDAAEKVTDARRMGDLPGTEAGPGAGTDDAQAALRESEERFRRAIVEAPVPIMIHAEDGEVVQISAAWTEMTGYAREEIPTIADWTERACGRRVETIRHTIDKLYDLDTRVDEGDFTVTTRAGQERIWSFSSAPLGRLADGRRAVISIAADVTDRRRAEEEVRRLNADLERRVCERTQELAETVGRLEREITERKQAEAALRESEVRLKTIIENMPVMVDAFDAAGKIVLWNRECERVTGYSAEEVIGNPRAMEQLYPDADYREAMIRQWTERGNDYREWDWTLTCKNGRTRTVSWSNISERFPIAGWAAWGIGVDVTAYREAVEKQRAADLRYRTLFEQSPDAVVIVDPETLRPIEFNDLAPKILGYEREEFPSSTIPEWEAVETPDQIRAHAEKILRDRSDVFETRMRTKTGQIREMVVNVRAIELGGRTVFHSIIRDVTEQKRAERKFRGLLESAPDGMVIVDGEGRIVLVNAQAEAMFGYPRADLLGQAVEILVPERFHTAHTQHRERLTRVRSSRSMGGGAKLAGRRRDGSEFTVEISLSTIETEDEILVASAIRDITEREQLEEQLRQSQKVEAVGTLAAGVAHDFNNALTAILGYAELARTLVPPEHEAVGALEGVARATRQAAGVTKSLLTFSRKTATEKITLDLGRVARESVELLTRMLPASIEVVTHIASETDLWVEADETQIQQIILNLAINARDAMPDGGTLRIGVNLEPAHAGEVRRTADRFVRLTVEDSGVGMDDAVRERIFDPFFTTKERGQGTGLGMAVVLGIVRDHRGVIDVRSTQGAGTTITVTFPGCPPPTADTAILDRAEAKRAAGDTVLVAEDDTAVREMTVAALRSAGFNVLEAADGVSALETLRSHGGAADLVLLDVDMPKLGGVACLRRLREIDPDMSAILMSGMSDDDLCEGHGGIAGFLSKPFGVETVVSAVRQAIAAARVRGEPT